MAKPAYATHGPRVLFDEAHYNLHTSAGLYKPFTDLITADGYRVTPNHRKFTRPSLKGFDILVISNALGAAAVFPPDASNPTFTEDASNPAFTEEECDAVRDWVRAGGALLLIADHSPMGAANARLGRRFGTRLASSFTRASADSPSTPSRRGAVQGIALPFGKGRAVVLAEAGMLSAQLAGTNRALFGMNRPGIDNRQLALNIMHWLSRKI